MVAGKLKTLAGMAALSLVFLSNVSEAAWMAGCAAPQTVCSSGRALRYGVWQGNANSLGLGITSTSSDYVYLYQVLSPSNPSTVSFTVTAATPNFVAGVVNNAVFSSATTFMVNTTTRSAAVSEVDGSSVLFNFMQSVTNVTNSPPSGIMFLVSSGAPVLGSLTLGAFRSSNDVTFQGPVPGVVSAPVPPALALMMLGLPMVGLIRRRLSK